MYHHEIFMRRCLQLAAFGKGTAAPNPLVGSVVVHQGVILAEGWHHHAGGPHAEVVALDHVPSHLRHLLPDATLYVNLEPCAHFGRTPPCANRIVEEGIGQVVIGCLDPFAEVNGKGVTKLEKHGISVLVGVCEKEALAINQRFFQFHARQRPWIILKWAETGSKHLAPLHQDIGQSVRISGDQARRLVHRMRSECQAILVGKNTWNLDQPKLDSRYWAEPSPLRLVLDPSATAKEPKENDGSILQLHSSQAGPGWSMSSAALPEALAIPHALCTWAYRQNIQSIFIEGGAQILKSFLETGLWDEIVVFRNPNIRWHNGIEAPHFSAEPNEKQLIGKDELLIYRQS